MALSSKSGADRSTEYRITWSEIGDPTNWNPVHSIEPPEDWVHDDAVKNWEFWVAWKRARLLVEREDKHEMVESELCDRGATPVSELPCRSDEADVATSECCGGDGGYPETR